MVSYSVIAFYRQPQGKIFTLVKAYNSADALECNYILCEGFVMKNQAERVPYQVSIEFETLYDAVVSLHSLGMQEIGKHRS